MVFSPQETDRYDWPLLQNGAVTLYWKIEVFESAIAHLAELDYRVLRLRFDDSLQFQHDLSVALKWREQFGYSPWNGSLDALEDGFRYEPFESTDDSAFCVKNFDALARSNQQLSFALLDMIERHSRDYLLFGKRLIGLIQTNDPEFHCEGIGATSANWNEAERLNKARGL